MLCSPAAMARIATATAPREQSMVSRRIRKVGPLSYFLVILKSPFTVSWLQLPVMVWPSTLPSIL